MTAAALTLTLVAVGIASNPRADAEIGGIFALTSAPSSSATSDDMPVELGVRFSSARSGVVTGIRFFAPESAPDTQTATLWDNAGEVLGSAPSKAAKKSGWRIAEFAEPIQVTAGSGYVASYFAPTGEYSGDINGFDAPITRGSITAPTGAGVYQYGGGFPQSIFHNTNYFVDVLFVADSTKTPAPRTSNAKASTPPPQQTATPLVPITPSTSAPLDLPRIPWEGGSDYWKQFPVTDAAGWDDPTFFPILAWYNGISTDAEVQYDKTLGINTYSGMWEGTPYSLFEDNGVFWIGGELNETFTAASGNWVGNFLDDEVDGRFTPEDGREHLQRIVDGYGDNGRFNYANFTQMISNSDLPASDAEAYVNKYTDAVSVDMYWYTIPHCDKRPYRDATLVPVEQSNCRTSSSYGKTLDSLRIRDAADGILQPLWQWVENLNGGPGEGPFTANIKPGQLRGAVMNSLIHEARGIAYFNQSFTGPCPGSSIFRQSQVTAGFCGAAQVEAAKTINHQIAALAPVLNSQSYDFTAGPDMDTMLKSYGDDIYLFAMVDGASQPGPRTFSLPPGIDGDTVEVLFEDRSIPVDESSHFSDTFREEYSYHVYRISR
ncbi:hypothetical protein L1277_001646 [Okibacterium sp. HSC-33S16]|uniref:DUF4082 domain-containing protein n=1 Tax=Okibacterium sp. HSC-33S16 TaxID=2910965 RepID=UPI00209D5F2A|nr:DUF4082 domain-containing protein [Okibacterium sp. HSC-33S16]MCP2031555.1 hypothetical protein [Okibacterium sp. HSC-33S16]